MELEGSRVMYERINSYYISIQEASLFQYKRACGVCVWGSKTIYCHFAGCGAAGTFPIFAVSALAAQRQERDLSRLRTTQFTKP